ncbi:MAG: O-antigen ligase family protein [Verrucomicrobiae bacterium]|nr:O-antigen ligase family protein [Verrucomicrobiae bacterium]
MWRHYPWLTALFLAPLLFGSVTAEGQAAVGLLLGLSVLLLVEELGRGEERWLPRGWGWLAVAGLALYLIPLPAALVQYLSPARAALAQQFPVASGSPERWMTLTLSPAGTVQRYWELLQAVVIFWLARQGAHRRGFPMVLVRFVLAALFLLVLSEAWLRWVDASRLLGIWENRYQYAAGTFANRNHFANWVYMGVLLVLGWGMRTVSPLHRACSEWRPRPRRRWPTLVLLVVVVVPALVAAVACGSRAGGLAFGAGLLTWLVYLARRSKNRTRLLVCTGAVVLVLLIMLAASGLVLDRLEGGAKDLSFKRAIWKDAMEMTLKFPWFGVGPGAFATAFNHFKTFGGDKTFWHAENDLVQWVAETGVAGLVWGLLLVGILLAKGAREALRRKVTEPEILIGALAALLAFLVHAQFEFVGQTQANLLLAAALLGLVVGMLEEPHRPEVPPALPRSRVVVHCALGGAVVMAAVAQGWSFWRWQTRLDHPAPEGQAAAIGQSLRLWPWASERRVACLRARVLALQREPRAEQIRQAAHLREEFLRALRLDPYQWELRLELAWLELAFSESSAAGREAAWGVMRLNPLQPRLGLRFARHFAVREPHVALEFLQAAPLERPEDLREALEIAWQAEPQPATLWSLTPDTPAALMTLADFALHRGLGGLAREACRQATNRVLGVEVATRFLRAGDVSSATNALGREINLPAGQWVLLQALMAGRQFNEAYRLAERLCRVHWPPGTLDKPLNSGFAEAGVEQWRARWTQTPTDTNVVLALAEAMYHLPAAQRDLAFLRQAAAPAASPPRLVYLLAQTEWDLGQEEAAARRMMALAERALQPVLRGGP